VQLNVQGKWKKVKATTVWLRVDNAGYVYLVGQVGSISAPFLNQPVVLLVQLNVRENGRR
jgi:hypothetical protein